ncbi:MAG: STAS domain-containing protein [bacterium]|nr:STAS domain-containing protein [bacterium]
MLRPKLLDTIKGYTIRQFGADAAAGTIVAIVALPLAIAFAIASGVSPEKGLFTAIVAGFIISALGGSRVQIGGPTGAFVVIIYGIVQQYGVDGLMAATLIAGVILIAMGLLKFGSVIKFIPHPVIVGFTTGIAVIIFSSQMNDLLGLGIKDLPADFIEKWIIILTHIGDAQLANLALGLGVIIVIVFWPRITTIIPSPFVALVAATAAVPLLNLPLETIFARFGEIPHSLPTPSLPDVNWSTIKNLIQPGITIAMLAGIEALLAAVVADGMISGKHRSNMELVAQGVANIASPIFGGIPATGAIARTATNVKNGGRTPVAGIVHAVVLLIIMLAFGKWAGLIPMAALAGIMIVVAYNMSEWRTFLAQLRGSKSDAAVLLSTFALTVLLDLTIALQVGLVIASIAFLRSMSYSSNVTAISESWDDANGLDDVSNFSLSPIPDGVRVFEINGPMFFGAAYKFKESLTVVGKPPKAIIVRMRQVPVIDATGVRTIEDVFHSFKKAGTIFLMSGAQPAVMKAMEDSGLLDQIGKENVLPTYDDALLRSREMLAAQSKTKT